VLREKNMLQCTHSRDHRFAGFLGRQRRIVAVIVAGLLVAGCGAQATVTTGQEIALAQVVHDEGDATTQEQAPTAADLAAIASYWEQRNAAFATGVDAGVAFLTERLPAGLAYTAEECRDIWFAGTSADVVERTTVVGATIEALSGWSMSSGPLQGVDAGSGVHRMAVDVRYDGAPGHVMDRRVAAVLQVSGDDVRNFLLCEQPQVQIAETGPEADPDADAGATATYTAPVSATDVAGETWRPAGSTLVATAPASEVRDTDEARVFASTSDCPNPQIVIRGDTAYIYCPEPAPASPSPPSPTQPGAPTQPAAEPAGTRGSGRPRSCAGTRPATSGRGAPCGLRAGLLPRGAGRAGPPRRLHRVRLRDPQQIARRAVGGAPGPRRAGDRTCARSAR
jgi:hypothetical protein